MLSWINVILDKDHCRSDKKASGGIGNVTDAAAVGFGYILLLIPNSRLLLKKRVVKINILIFDNFSRKHINYPLFCIFCK